MQSVNNRSYLPLSANSKYTGSYDSVIDYQSATINLFSDSNCEIVVYQSANKVITQAETFTTIANTQFSQILPLYQPYIYFTVLNTSSTSQTVMNFSVIYRNTSIPASQIQNISGSVSVSNLNNHIASTLSNNITITAGGSTSSVQLNNNKFVTIFGNSSGATTLTVQFSTDNINFYSSQNQITITSASNFGFAFPCTCSYIRLLSSSAINLLALIEAS